MSIVLPEPDANRFEDELKELKADAELFEGRLAIAQGVRLLEIVGMLFEEKSILLML